MLGATFGFLPSEFIQVGLHLLGHFSVPIPAPFPSPPLFPLRLSSSKTLVMVPPLSHLQADQLNISSQPEAANLRLLFLVLGLVSSSIFSTCDIKRTDARLFALLLHHQHPGVSITPILAENVPTAPCHNFELVIP